MFHVQQIRENIVTLLGLCEQRSAVQIN